ncbi:hypothetical protein AVEN_101094-1 [Araneus ventricosus]|uniref:Sushi domain-containing protein n=1 Tax=Araneus ventricosus TaxID=182803 RepID=A0A4Y2N2A4_ARAVE|nr:hypothetical protein AVEN_101094-1 [Araneus ventricosus]
MKEKPLAERCILIAVGECKHTFDLPPNMLENAAHNATQQKETLCDPVVANVNPSEGEWESDGKSAEYSVGTKMTLKCSPGYHSEGHPLTVTCRKSGTWTRTSATCKKNKLQKDNKILRKKHLEIIKIPWRSREKCRIELQVNAEQYRYKGVEEKPEKYHKILGKTFVMRQGKMAWHSQEKDKNELKLNTTQRHYSGIEDKSQKDYKILAIVAGSALFTVILILFGLKIFLIPRKRTGGVFVIRKPGENNSYSTLPSAGGLSTTDLSEAEYSPVYIMKQSKTAG